MSVKELQTPIMGRDKSSLEKPFRSVKGAAGDETVREKSTLIQILFGNVNTP